MFRLIRDSDVEINEEAEDLVLLYESALKRRRRGDLISISVNSAMPAELRDFLFDQLEIAGPDADRACLPSRPHAQHRRPRRDYRRRAPRSEVRALQARFPERIRDFGGDCFAAIRAKDIVVHHPYESFDVVVQFLARRRAIPA